ncbi:MAG TPA: TadE/TadG family type IV pilus assembly protein [Candidatus Limnocylindrales bacterium]
MSERAAPQPSSHRFRYRGAGQALVEFALILPILILVTVGVVDLARISTTWVSLINGVREGALYASIDPKETYWCMNPATAPAGSIACPAGATTATASSVTDCAYVTGDPVGNWCPDPSNVAYRIKEEASGLQGSRVTLFAPICATGDDAVPADAVVACSDSSAASVTITASYSMDMITPVIGNLLGHPFRMTASATAAIFR